jgi:hypothetical protein
MAPLTLGRRMDRRILPAPDSGALPLAIALMETVRRL